MKSLRKGITDLRMAEALVGFGARTSERGFTLTEVLVVVPVVLLITALSAPLLLHSVYASKVHAASTDLAGLVQQARMLAARQNTTLPVIAGTVETKATGAFIGPSGATGSTTWATGDSDVPYPSGISNCSASSVPTALSPGFTPESAGTTLYFGPRGLPMKLSGGTYVLSNGVIFYVCDINSNWSAVSVSGAGRSKVWMLHGSTWN